MLLMIDQLLKLADGRVNSLICAHDLVLQARAEIFSAIKASGFRRYY